MSTLRRRIMGAIKPEEDYSMYAVHKKVNPEVMAICYAQGWAANENYMTFEEAAAVTDIGTAFRNNRNITSFNEFQYFTNVTSLVNQAFYNDSNLEYISFPSSLTTIGQQIFTNCYSIYSLEIGRNVTTISSLAFHQSGIVTFTIDTNAFSYNTNGFNQQYFGRCNINEFVIGEHCTNIKNDNKTLYNDDYKLLLFCPQNQMPTFHTGVETLGNQSLSYLELDVLTIPDSVTSVRVNVFGFVNIGTLNLPNVVTFGTNAIANCTVGKLYIPKANVYENYPFGGNISFIDIGDEVTHIDNAFLNTKVLGTFICRSITPPTAGNNPFRDSISKGTGYIYVPDESLDDYKSASGWNLVADYIKPLSEYVYTATNKQNVLKLADGTNFKFRNGLTVEMDVFVNELTSYRSIIGRYNGYYNIWFNLNRVYSKYNNQQSYSTISDLPLNQKLNFKYIDNVVYLNDEAVITHTPQGEWEDTIDAIFGYFSGGYYYLKIKEGNKLLFDLIPYNVNGNMMMYDRINNVTYS